jgi:SOS-response transcriptional repressor LexA
MEGRGATVNERPAAGPLYDALVKAAAGIAAEGRDISPRELGRRIRVGSGAAREMVERLRAAGRFPWPLGASWRQRQPARSRRYCGPLEPGLPLNERQASLLRFIYETARDRGYQPNYKEMSEFLGHRKFAPNAIARRGYLDRQGDLTSRGLRILRRPDGRKFEGFAEPAATGPPPDGEPATTLSVAQANVLRLIYEGARDRGYQPEYREMMATLGYRSLNAIPSLLRPLERAGYVRRPDGFRARAIELLRTPSGTVFAGFLDKPATDQEGMP